MPANEMTVEALLRAHAPHAPEALRERVLALEPVRRPRRRLALVAVGAAATVAVGAAVVHGFVGSGSPSAARTDSRANQLQAYGSAVTVPAWRSAVPKAVGAGGSATADTPKTILVPSSRLQHADASVSLQVPTKDDVASTTTSATRVATSLGGYAQSVRYDSHGSAVLDLRIPTRNVERALSRLAALGTLVSQNISITDLQQQLQSQTEAIASLRRTISTLETALRDPSLPAAQRVILQLRLGNAKRSLAERLQARKGTVAAGAVSHVSLQITAKKPAAAVPHPRGRLGRIVHSALGFLAIEGIVVLFALIVASPIALVAFLVWLWRRRSIDRLLAA